MVELLNKCEVDLNLCNFDGRTVGHLASDEGHVSLLVYLAENSNFNFDQADRWGHTTRN